MSEALIWGASGGIGRALCDVLAANGWKVFAAVRDETRAPASAAAVLEFDATRAFSFSAAAMSVAQESAGLDLVVYTPGVMRAAPVDGFDADVWREVFAVTLDGAQQAARASLPLLREGGHWMAIGAYTEKLVLPGFSGYAAAKAGVALLVQVLQKENRRRRFTLVRPGAVDTPFWTNVPFSLPRGAMSAQAVAEAMLAHHQGGGSGVLDL